MAPLGDDSRPHGEGDQLAFLTPVVPQEAGDAPRPPPDSRPPTLDSQACASSSRAAPSRLTCQKRVLLFLEESDSSFGAQIFSHVMLLTIVLSIFSFVVQTVPALKDVELLNFIDVASTAMFTLEYFFRFWACTASDDGITRWRWFKSPMNVLDLCSILPIYLVEDMEALKPFRALRAVRLIRIFRVLKLSKYSSGMNLMVVALVNSARPLWILGFFLGNGVVLWSSTMYYTERAGCPDIAAMSPERWREYRQDCDQPGSSFTQSTLPRLLCCNEFGAADEFESIPATFWWCIVTMTTVGYGDVVPRTLPGQAVGSMTMITGILLISLPVAIVGSKFHQAYELSEEAKEAAKHKEVAIAKGEARRELRQLAPSEDEGDKSDEDPTKDPDNELNQRAAQLLKSATRLMNKGEFQVMSAADQRKTQVSAQMEPLKARLREMEKNRCFTFKAQGQINLLYELFAHIEEVETKIGTLQEKDASYDVCLRSHFTELAKAYDRASP